MSTVNIAKTVETSHAQDQDQDHARHALTNITNRAMTTSEWATERAGKTVKVTETVTAQDDITTETETGKEREPLSSFPMQPVL